MPSTTITRRDFAAAAAGALALADTLAGEPAPAGPAALDLAEWSYFWVGVERAPLARGLYTGGKQMYVEYWIPAVVKHPIPILMVHAEGGQGLDWMGTPDERPGWATLLLQQGWNHVLVRAILAPGPVGPSLKLQSNQADYLGELRGAQEKP